MVVVQSFYTVSVKFSLLFFPYVALLTPFVLTVYCTYDTCIILYCVYYLFEDCTCITFYCVYYLFSLSIIFRSHILPTCTNLSVIVIDKPIGLGGTVYTSTSIFVSHLCTIYHLNKRFETLCTLLYTRNPFSYSHFEIFICMYSVRGEIDQISTNTSRNSTCCAANVYMFVYIFIGAL